MIKEISEIPKTPHKYLLQIIQMLNHLNKKIMVLHLEKIKNFIKYGSCWVNGEGAQLERIRR